MKFAKVLMILAMLSVLLLVIACQQTAMPAVTDQKVVKSTETSSDVVGIGNMVQVVIENDQFMPTSLEAKVGDIVEWVNKDDRTHTVTFENGIVDESLPVSGMVSYKFTETGNFAYHCSIHPSMQGNVVVS